MNVNFHQQKATLRHLGDVGLPIQAGRTEHCCALGVEITKNGGDDRAANQGSRVQEKQVDTNGTRPISKDRFLPVSSVTVPREAPGDPVTGLPGFYPTRRTDPTRPGDELPAAPPEPHSSAAPRVLPDPTWAPPVPLPFLRRPRAGTARRFRSPQCPLSAAPASKGRRALRHRTSLRGSCRHRDEGSGLGPEGNGAGRPQR